MHEIYRAAEELVKTRGGDKELKSIRREQEALKQKEKERKAELDAMKKTRDKSSALSVKKKTRQVGVKSKTGSGERRYHELVPGKKVDRRGENSEDAYGSDYGSGSNFDEPGKDEPKPTSRAKTQSVRSEQRGNSDAQASGSKSGRKDHGSTEYASSIATESTLKAEKPERSSLGEKDRTARQSDVPSSESQRRSKHSSRPEEKLKKHETAAEKIRRNNEFAEKLREQGHGPAPEDYQASEYSAVPSLAESRLSLRDIIKDGKQPSQRSVHGEDSGRSTRHRDREHRDRDREHKDRDRKHKDRDREHKDRERKHRSKGHEIPLRIKDTESEGRRPHKSSRHNAPGSETSSTTRSSRSSRTTSSRSYDKEPDSGSETETENRSRDKRSHGRSRDTYSEYYSTRDRSPTNASQVSRNTEVRRIKGPVDEDE
ncbi:hypothetical protein BOTCAL_0049g00060 [Botryotinia calthae]|uniref:Uncharacterized protein n=1 Tax=Botryotinia calthae TaxID=38488 RepID=A0A4Y8DB20_9HELO|nr:hypothetical protein BOTCAL_0049g00060 [Botryotinia calthae]